MYIFGPTPATHCPSVMQVDVGAVTASVAEAAHLPWRASTHPDSEACPPKPPIVSVAVNVITIAIIISTDAAIIKYSIWDKPFLFILI